MERSKGVPIGQITAAASPVRNGAWLEFSITTWVVGSSIDDAGRRAAQYGEVTDAGNVDLGGGEFISQGIARRSAGSLDAVDRFTKDASRFVMLDKDGVDSITHDRKAWLKSLRRRPGKGERQLDGSRAFIEPTEWREFMQRESNRTPNQACAGACACNLATNAVDEQALTLRSFAHATEEAWAYDLARQLVPEQVHRGLTIAFVDGDGATIQGRYFPSRRAILVRRHHDPDVTRATLVHELAHPATYVRQCGTTHGHGRCGYVGQHHASFYKVLEPLHRAAGTPPAAAVAVEGDYHFPAHWRTATAF